MTHFQRYGAVYLALLIVLFCVLACVFCANRGAFSFAGAFLVLAGNFIADAVHELVKARARTAP